MHPDTKSTIWRRIGIIIVLLAISPVFPVLLLVVAFLAWTIYEDLKPSQDDGLPPPTTWRDAKVADADWLTLFSTGCESPAEEKFLREMVKAADLKPANGKLVAPDLILEMQVKFDKYRFDFLANQLLVIEIDGAAYHSSPEAREHDRIRDTFCVANGFEVLRIPAADVFNKPEEIVRRAIARAKLAKLAAKGRQDEARASKPTVSGKTRSFLGKLDDALSMVSQSIDDNMVRQRAAAAFMPAVEQEKKQLEGLVGLAELKQEIAAQSPQHRENFDRNYAELLKACSDSGVAVGEPHRYTWPRIGMPAPLDDARSQRMSESVYRHAMEQRAERMATLNQRCKQNPSFALELREVLDGADYPYEDAKIIFRGTEADDFWT